MDREAMKTKKGGGGQGKSTVREKEEVGQEWKKDDPLWEDFNDRVGVSIETGGPL